jgi:hypothetical protein
VRYVQIALITALIMAVVAHYVTSEPMPWWPDTAIFGGFMGALAAFLVMRLVHEGDAIDQLRRIGRALIGKEPR